ncbi:MAG TPA: flagellar basal body L-ring protein FlgH [Steroidobacteraceae bacterium]|nr:flagellar basal body L-ring protein FlgH [Steroidobacteraceae bacterium]
MNRHANKLLVVAAALLATGCAALKEDQGREFDATWPDVVEMPKATAGAIYAQGTETSLWQNVTARNIGDTLTVRLEESTDAKKAASSSSGKSTSAELTGPTVLGRPITSNGTPILEGSLGNETKFSGNGAATQSNSLDGYISVTVAKRLQNGNLLVRGQKWIAINSGREFVRLQGIVRPSDISPDNSVSSYKIADAYIAYGGQGTIANANKPGFLYRFFNSPYTPF